MYATLVGFWALILLPYSFIRGWKHAITPWTWRDLSFVLLMHGCFAMIMTILWFDFFNWIAISCVVLLISTVFLIGHREQHQQFLLLLRLYYFTLLMSVIAGAMYELVNGETLYTLFATDHALHSVNVIVTMAMGCMGLEYVFLKQINTQALQFFLAKIDIVFSASALFLLLIKALGMILILSRSHHSLVITSLFGLMMLIESGFVSITIFYIAKIYHFSVFKYRHEVLNETYALQVQHLAEIEAKSRAVRRLSHDIHNHKIILSELLHKGDYAQAQVYVHQLHPDQPLDKRDEPVSEHGILNALYQQKKVRCEQAQIDLHVVIRMPKEIAVRDFDLCVLFGNLFDNAIEATRQCPQAERTIRLHVEVRNQNLLIQMENPFVGQIRKSGGRIISSKGDQVMHGIGLTNIHEVVAQYEGNFTFTIENQWFCAQIRIPLVEN